MHKTVFFIALTIAFVLMQGQSLHGHYTTTTHTHSDHPHALNGHDNLHIHSHTASDNEEEINLLGTPHLRYIFLDQPIMLQSSIWSIVLMLLWICIDLPVLIPKLLQPRPPALIRPSPRAPPG
jgi:hypothetical protein